MLPVKKILYPTDFSPCAREALDIALWFAEQFDAELHMFHAVLLDKEEVYNPAFHFEEPQELSERVHSLAKTNLSALLEPNKERLLRIKEVQESGLYAGPLILDYADKEEIDLIIMGTHGRRDPIRFLLGSVAEEILRGARCPILTVRQQPPSSEQQRFQRILVPLDFSEDSRQALKVAVDLAMTHEAELQLLHVIHRPKFPSFYSTSVGNPYLEDDNVLSEKALEQLHECMEPYEISYETHVVLGYPTQQIIQFAEGNECDCVVLASHGLGGFKRILLGSTTEQLVRSLQCPVLTVKTSLSSKKVDDRAVGIPEL